MDIIVLNARLMYFMPDDVVNNDIIISRHQIVTYIIYIESICLLFVNKTFFLLK